LAGIHGVVCEGEIECKKKSHKRPQIRGLDFIKQAQYSSSDESSVKWSLLTFCRLSSAVSSWGPAKGQGRDPGLPTWQNISGVFKRHSKITPSVVISLQKAESLPDNEHFALIGTVELIRFKLLAGHHSG
jgi:hypothetical protein